MAISKEKSAALNKVLSGINKQFGEGTVNIASKIQEQLKVVFIETPSSKLNAALNGGFGKGKIVELYGPQSSGKTSAALQTIAKNQKKDPNFTAGWFETEESFDPDFAIMLGVDMDRFVYWDQKDYGAEGGLDVLRGLVASGEFDMIVVNSVAGLTPMKEIEGEIADQNVALQARIMSKLMRVITGVAAKKKCLLVFINQVRTNVGQKYGNPDVAAGGRALAFYASQRVIMSKYSIQKEDPISADEGVKINCTIAKNRLCKDNPYKQCHYYAIYGEGIEEVFELPPLLEQYGVLRKAGAHWYYESAPKQVLQIAGVEGHWKSKQELINFLKSNEAGKQQLEELLSKAMGGIDIKAAEKVDEKTIDEFEKLNRQLEEEFAGEEAPELEVAQ